MSLIGGAWRSQYACDPVSVIYCGLWLGHVVLQLAVDLVLVMWGEGVELAECVQLCITDLERGQHGLRSCCAGPH